MICLNPLLRPGGLKRGKNNIKKQTDRCKGAAEKEGRRVVKGFRQVMTLIWGVAAGWENKYLKGVGQLGGLGKT